MPCFICFLVVALLSRGIHAQETLSSRQYTADFDSLWSTLRTNYAYFDKKQTDWQKVRDVYRPRVAGVRSKREFVSLLEAVLDELYDPHTHLKVNTASSFRIVPTGLDVWAEWQHDKPVITELRRGFSAEQAGLKVGMEIVSVNGIPIEEAVERQVGKCLKRSDPAVRDWALRKLLAGTHDGKRFFEAKDLDGAKRRFELDLPGQLKVDDNRNLPQVESKLLKDGIAYIAIHDLGAVEVVAGFDSALEELKSSRGMIIDLRETPSGGNTSVAEPILGRLIAQRMGYQRIIPLHKKSWIREVSPRGKWSYKAPMVVLVDHWTGSMGEGMAIGLDAMKRATIVGTHMAGLNGAVHDLELPNTKFRLSYAAEKLEHMNGTPREDFMPPVAVNLMEAKFSSSQDPILEVGIEVLKSLLKGSP